MEFQNQLVQSFLESLASLSKIALFMAGAIVTSAAYFYWRSRGVVKRIPGSLIGYVFPTQLYSHPTSNVDRKHFVFTMLLWQPLVQAVVATHVGISITSALSGSFGQMPQVIDRMEYVISAQVVALYLSLELGNYIAHYTLHKIPILWSIHRTHHSAEALTIFSGFRGHPLSMLYTASFQAAFSGLGGGFVAYATGTTLLKESSAMLAAIPFFFLPLLYLQHSHVPISLGWTNRILAAPVMHQIHHSAELRHRDKNFGGSLMIFDWMFGTLYMPSRNEEYRWGLNSAELDRDNPHLRLRDLYLEPLRHAWRTLRNQRNGERPPTPRPAKRPDQLPAADG